MGAQASKAPAAAASAKVAAPAGGAPPPASSDSLQMSSLDSGELMQLYQYGRAPAAIVQHYIPANLPIQPVLQAAYVADCNRTWKHIVTATTDKMKEYGKSGFVLFYDEFFFRLFQRDITFAEVFPSIKRRAEILVKALTLMLKANTENVAQLMNRVRYLGHRHRSFPKLRAHQFASYSTCVIEVMMYWLGEHATPDVAEAWSHLVGFFLKHILESFLADRVDPFESYQNTNLTSAQDEETESVDGKSMSAGKMSSARSASEKKSAR